MQAALEGSEEVGFTVLSMCLSLSAVFIPLMFMGGIIGRLFREFAITIGVAILVSGFVALTLTPMLCSRLLKPKHEEKHGRLFHFTERLFDGALHGYERSLAWVMRHRPFTLAFSALILVLDGRAVDRDARRGCFRPTTPARSTRRRRRRRARRSSRCCASRSSRARGCRATRTSRRTRRTWAAAWAAVRTQVSYNVTLKPIGQRPPADEMVRELTRRHERDSRAADLRHQSAGDPHRRARHEDALPVHAARAGHHAALRAGERAPRAAASRIRCSPA